MAEEGPGPSLQAREVFVLRRGERSPSGLEPGEARDGREVRDEGFVLGTAQATTAGDALTAAARSRCRVLLGQTKGLSLAQVQDEVQRGAKFVVFGYCTIGPLGFG